MIVFKILNLNKYIIKVKFILFSHLIFNIR